MSDTPETDAAWFCAHEATRFRHGEDLLVDADFARNLEIERNTLLNAIRAYRDAKGRYHTQLACERLLELLPESVPNPPSEK